MAGKAVLCLNAENIRGQVGNMPISRMNLGQVDRSGCKDHTWRCGKSSLQLSCFINGGIRIVLTVFRKTYMVYILFY